MALHVGTGCPSLQGATEWIGNTINVEELAGVPFLVVFWSVSCQACLVHLSSMQNWQNEYAVSGLKIVAVHSPRVLSDCDVAAVRHFLQLRKLELPCAVDNERVIAQEFQTDNIWPYYFLFGKDGKMKCRAASDTGLKLLERSLVREMKLIAAP